MSTPSFRTRNLDSNRAVYVYRNDEEPLEQELLHLNSCAPSLPSGMEKDEETEHHLLQALTAQQQFGSAKALKIPIPLITDIGPKYDKFYPRQFNLPQHLIHLQLISDEILDVPGYDMDSEDEAFYLDKVKRFPEISRVEFESIITKLEDHSGYRNAISLDAAMLSLKTPKDVICVIYHYWLYKRERMGRPLLFQIAYVKDLHPSAANVGSSSYNNPYVAFRKRLEKMQTRKNRKIDEFYYQRMFRLRREFEKALRLFHMLKNRENLKHQMITNLLQTARTMHRIGDYRHILTSYEKSSRINSSFNAPSPLPLHSSSKRFRDNSSHFGDHPTDYEDFDILHDDSGSGIDNSCHLLPPRVITKTVFREVRPLPPKESLDAEFTFQRRRGCRYSIPLRNFDFVDSSKKILCPPSRFKRPLNQDLLNLESANQLFDNSQTIVCYFEDELVKSSETDVKSDEVDCEYFYAHLFSKNMAELHISKHLLCKGVEDTLDYS